MIGTLFAALMSVNAPRMARRLRRAVIDYAFAGVAFRLGAGFLLAAAFIWAAERWGGFEAALGFGIGFMALAVITMMVHRFVVVRRSRRRDREIRAEQMKSLAAATAMASIPALVRQAGIVGSIAVPLVALAAYVVWQVRKPQDPDETD